MSVAQLNSIHLEAPRREQFRRARDVLLQSRGSETVMLEAADLAQAKLRLQENIFEKPRDDSGSTSVKIPRLFINNRVDQPLRVGNNSIGRSSECDIVLCDGMISRKHCVLLVHSNGSCELHDMASKNGTFLNKVRINSPTRVRPGDEIQIGDIRMVILEAEAAPGTPPPAAADNHTSILPPQRPAC